MSNLQLSSPQFEDGAAIPVRFTCEGENINPPLRISGVPEDTQAFALIVTDPDIPEEVKEQMGIEVFDHWVTFNIPVDVTEISADETVGTPGKNSSGSLGYTGPCPPAEYEPTEHRYVFRIYALDATIDLPQGATKQEVLNRIKDHALDTAQLVGLYEKQQV